MSSCADMIEMAKEFGAAKGLCSHLIYEKEDGCIVSSCPPYNCCKKCPVECNSQCANSSK